MSYFYKIFFVGIVALSVAFGGHFDASSRVNGEQATIVTLSADETDKPAEAGKLQSAATPNGSTTEEDAQTATEEPGYQKQNVADDTESVLSNNALLKSDSSFNFDAFKRVDSDPPPAIQAQSALVADLKTGRAYFELNPTLRWPTASLAKLVTAAMTLKNIDPNKRIPISSISSADLAVAGNGEPTSSSFFAEGETYSVNDLFMAMLLASKNEAAEALASAYGERSAFVAGMNAMAKEFGMDSTNFSDPTGLSVSDQSNVLDLEKLALNIYLNYPKIFEATKKKTAAATELNSGKKKIVSNINTFAGTAGFLGGKTGYTDEANGNLLSVFSYGGRPILIIVLGTDDRFGETNNLLQWFEKNFQKN